MVKNKETYLKIKQLREEGKSITAISKEIGVSFNTVKNYLKTNPDEAVFYLTDEEKKGIIKNIEATKMTKAEDIAKKYNCSMAWARSIISKRDEKSNNDTICWRCENVCKCNWGKWFVPVKGWTAEKTINEGRVSYIVRECPQFKEG